jgi:hypothetical protein
VTKAEESAYLDDFEYPVDRLVVEYLVDHLTTAEEFRVEK